MNCYKDCHFVPLSSQGNIYTSSCIKLANGYNKLLLAALKRQVICFEYQENQASNLYSTTRHISFTYIPSGAEIISLDVFNKSENGNDFVFGITIIKKGFDLSSSETYYLNIYSEWEESADLNIESISQNCLNIELKFVPYHLTHTYLITWNNDSYKKEVVFLLSGSDIQIHVYKENQTNHTYREIDYTDIFPEFSKLPSIITWLDVFYFEDFKERLTAFGCECGYFRICRVSSFKNEILFRFSTNFDNVISKVQIFTRNETILTSTEIDVLKTLNLDKRDNDELILDVLVTNTLVPAVIFRDVVNYGLKKYTALCKYETTGVISCAEVADIDFDGRKEIIFGTSTQELLVYKNTKDNDWVLESVKNFPSPIFSIKHMDITGDGIKEILVVSMKGLHVLQPDLNHVAKIFEKKIKVLGTVKKDNLTIFT